MAHEEFFLTVIAFYFMKKYNMEHWGKNCNLKNIQSDTWNYNVEKVLKIDF